jgi:hypothetical protein
VASGIEGLCLEAAKREAAAGRHDLALEWLERIPADRRPRDLVGRLHYQGAKQALAAGQWGLCEQQLQKAQSAAPTPLFTKRIELVRRRKPLVDDATWTTLINSVDPARRLPVDHLAPDVSAIWSCGAYHSRGATRQLPWSRFLRMAKWPSEDKEEQAAILKLAVAFLCRFVAQETRLLRSVDAVAAIPANPARYSARMMSLPDELARGIEEQLAVPFIFDAVVFRGDEEVETKTLSWAERRRVMAESFEPGDVGIASGHVFLLVDDVTTSGATLVSAARCLRAAGATDVCAITLSHTEG